MCVARSAFYGPNAQGRLELAIVAGNAETLAQRCSGHAYAIHISDTGTEFSCLDTIMHRLTSRLPLLHVLLGPSHRGSAAGAALPAMTARTCDSQFGRFRSHLGRTGRGRMRLAVCRARKNELCARRIAMHRLNADQAAALRACAQMLSTADEEEMDGCAPALLVHGVFGAGKSFLLAVMVLFLIDLFEESDAVAASGRVAAAPSAAPLVPTWKVLVASTTNVAVDRVLLCLLSLGHDQFVRVGSVRKIAKPVLPYCVQTGAGADRQDLRDLQDMLQANDLDAADRTDIRRAMERIQTGEYKRLLAQARVVGTTCAATLFPCLDALAFPVLLLDECSQMTEPLSLLPIARFHCERIVLVGDPKQLPPTVGGPEAAHRRGLEQTLFDRLAEQGVPAILLRTQYRCHPLISAIPNSLFYDSLLRDGVSADERPPLHERLRTLCFVDEPNGHEQLANDGSVFNVAEAAVAVTLVTLAHRYGLSGAQISVICPYRAQAARIAEMLRTREGGSAQCVQVSTVDAFQGAERDFIVLSCVRTHSVGFVDSCQRMNVALSRARQYARMRVCRVRVAERP